MRSNDDFIMIQMPNVETRSKSKNVMMMVKGMLLLMIIIGATFTIMYNETTTSNQRHLNAAAAESILPFFVRMQDGELRAFEVLSSAHLNDIYQAIELNVGHIVSLSFNGQTLPNDEATLVADIGICAESIIYVSPANDLQILDRAVKNRNQYL